MLLAPDSDYESEIDAEEASVHNSGTAANENGVVEEMDDPVTECRLPDSALLEPPSPPEDPSPFNGAGFNWSQLQGTPRRSSVAEKKARIELVRGG